ncbi:MAG: TetR/AcrR family transcriptional regulator [Oligoflexus sp.]
MKKRTKHVEKTEATKNRIIMAAIQEFGQRGISGTTIEDIAAASSCNKALIYRHFGSREELYKDVIHYIIHERRQVFEDQPQTLEDLLSYWVDNTQSNRDVLRLFMQEAIRFGLHPIPFLKEQTNYYKLQAQKLQNLNLPPAIRQSPKMFLLALISLVTFPFAFPQITKMVTGANAESQAFNKRWKEFLVEMLRG